MATFGSTMPVVQLRACLLLVLPLLLVTVRHPHGLLRRFEAVPLSGPFVVCGVGRKALSLSRLCRKIHPRAQNVKMCGSESLSFFVYPPLLFSSRFTVFLFSSCETRVDLSVEWTRR